MIISSNRFLNFFLVSVMQFFYAVFLLSLFFKNLEAVTPNEIKLQVPSFSNIVTQVKPAVVSVQVTRKMNSRDSIIGELFGGSDIEQLPDDHPIKRFFREFEERNPKNNNRSQGIPIAQGSGFFVSRDGYVVTNNHVVSEGVSYSVTLDDGSEFKANLVGIDSNTDLAVLKVNAKKHFTYVSFSDDKNIHVGDWVLAVGNPFGLGGTVTAGIVSARGRNIGSEIYDNLIQIDAAINRGNSGGPAFDLNGKVVGINTAIISPSGGNVGIAFAIPSSIASKVVNQIIKKGSVDRSWIGMKIQTLTKEISESIGLKKQKGVIVSEIITNSPSEKAGIKPGDVIVSINGEKIKTIRDISRKISIISPGDTAVLSIWHNEKKIDVNVKLIVDPKDHHNKKTNKKKFGERTSLEDYGITAIPSEDGNGLFITKIHFSSDAAIKGIHPGDIIRSVNNKILHKSTDFFPIAKDAIKNGKKSILFLISNNDGSYFVSFSIKKR